MDIHIRLEAAAHAAVTAFFDHLRDADTVIRTETGDAGAAVLAEAFASGRGRDVLISLAGAPAGTAVTAASIAAGSGSTATGVLAAIGVAAKKIGGYRALPLTWTGAGVDQAIEIDAATRAALRDRLGLDEEGEK